MRYLPFALLVTINVTAAKMEMLPANIFVELAEKVNPAVVNISTKKLIKNGDRTKDPFFEMFEQFMGNGMFPSLPKSFQALGTGFIIRKDGLILTNSHVIEGADVVQVTLMNKPDTIFEAEVIGKDPRTDIALIKISGKGKFPVAQLGSSAKVRVGEWVAAFGNPFGHSNTMTKGIISAIGREIEEINRVPFLQTDASINQGNSGGPLVNIKGRVIGVNTAIDARAQGIGFAIPIDNIKSILTELEKNGYIRRGFIGVQMDNLNPMTSRSLELDSTDGVVVLDVQPGSPAKKAGIHEYDVIIKFGKKNISSTKDLSLAVQDTPVNETRKMIVIRSGSKKTLTIKVGSRQSAMASNKPRSPQIDGQKAPHDLGFWVEPLSEKMAQGYEIDISYVGQPIVTKVTNSSPAQIAGLQTGDIIIDVNRKTVRSIAKMRSALKVNTNLLKLLRGNRTLLVIIEK